MRGSHQPLSVSASQLELKQLQRLPNKLLLVMFPWRGTTAENLTEGVYKSICQSLAVKAGFFRDLEILTMYSVCKYSVYVCVCFLLFSPVSEFWAQGEVVSKEVLLWWDGPLQPEEGVVFHAGFPQVFTSPIVYHVETQQRFPRFVLFTENNVIRRLCKDTNKYLQGQCSSRDAFREQPDTRTFKLNNNYNCLGKQEKLKIILKQNTSKRNLRLTVTVAYRDQLSGGIICGIENKEIHVSNKGCRTNWGIKAESTRTQTAGG